MTNIDDFKEIIVSEEAKEKLDELRSAYRRLSVEIDSILTNMREKSLAQTYLQTSCMYAVRAYAISFIVK